MFAIERGCKVNKKQKPWLAPWEGLLEEWGLLYERYGRILEEEDSPCFNKERANVGVLAGAAWRCGWVCLTEWPIQRQKKDGIGEGRNDLWIASTEWSWCIEAKFEFIKPAQAVREATALLETACSDALSVRTLDYTSLVGVALCPLYLSCDSVLPPQAPIEQQLSQMVCDLMQLSDLYDVCAWCFPPSLRELTDRNEKPPYRYPGLILLAREVKSRSR